LEMSQNYYRRIWRIFFIYWSFIQSGEEEQTPEERRTRLKKADSIRRMLADGSTVPVVTSKILLFYLFVGYLLFFTANYTVPKI
jgi:hypothetical protein